MLKAGLACNIFNMYYVKFKFKVHKIKLGIIFAHAYRLLYLHLFFYCCIFSFTSKKYKNIKLTEPLFFIFKKKNDTLNINY